MSVRPYFPPVAAVVRFNDIAGNAAAGLRVAPSQASTLDARCNWWGSHDGPSGVGSGSGDALVPEPGTVSQPGAATPAFVPWASAPIAGTGETSCSGGTGQ